MVTPRSVSARIVSPGAQRGVMLLEALIAILIFSIGILGIVGLQATAVQQSSDARYRAQAAQLAEQLIGRMWTDNHSVANLQSQYTNPCKSGTCPAFQDWLVNNVSAKLPGVSASSNAPLVDVDATGIVNIIVYWRLPSDDPGAPAHHYDTSAQIVQQ